MDYLFSIRKYLEYLWKGKIANQIHSPFVFELYNEVLFHPYNFYAFGEIEKQRDQLLRNNKQIEYEDLGAKKRTVKTSISSLAMKSLMPADESQMLFQLVNWLKPKRTIELGTSLGITSSYLASGYETELITFEGISEIANEAKSVWNTLKINPIKLIDGKIEETLPSYLKSNPQPIDLVILDANHSYEATMENFERLKSFMHNDSCMVFDDIYWSAGMAKAWKEIIQSPEVTINVDLFKLGIVFFRKESKKENFVIRW